MPAADREQFTSQPRYPAETGAPAGTVTERPVAERPVAAEVEEKRAVEFVGGGSVAEAVAGAAAIVLAIIGLASTGTIVFYMMTIGTIALGIGLLFHGASMASRFHSLLGETADTRFEEAEFGTGISAEFLAGIAGVVLGILALINIAPTILCSIAVIVFGGALVLSSGAVGQLGDLHIRRFGASGASRHWTRQMTMGAAGTQALVGVAALVLGILALVGIVPEVLCLAGLLSLGCALLVSGGTVGSRLMALLGRG